MKRDYEKEREYKRVLKLSSGYTRPGICNTKVRNRLVLIGIFSVSSYERFHIFT